MMEFKILGDICNIVSGGTPPRSKSQYWDNGNIPWIKIRDIKSKYIEDSEESITIEGLNNSSTKLLTKGTVLYTIFATLGEVGILKIDACTNQAIAGLTVKDETKILPEYLYYYLKSKKNIVNKLGRGAAQNNINLSMLKSFEIEIIDIIKQNNIIRTLNYVDNLIKLKSRELELLDELVKARFVEMFGDIISNDKNWNSKPLKELCDISRGASPRPISDYLGGTIPWIKIGDATIGDSIYINSTKEHIIKEGVRKSRFIKKGSLIFANCGVSLGFCRIINFDGCIHDGWLAFQNIDTSLNKIFLLTTINQMTGYFRKIAPGGTQPNLNTDIVGNYIQVVPPLELQNQFADFVKEVDKSRFIIKSMIKEGLL